MILNLGSGGRIRNRIRCTRLRGAHNSGLFGSNHVARHWFKELMTLTNTAGENFSSHCFARLQNIA